MSEVRITAEPRTEFGKGAARRVRRAHKVPAVIYGHGSEPRHVSLPGHDLMIALKGGANTLLRLDIEGGESELALPRAITRDPIKGFLEHVDLLLVRRGEKVAVEVPVTVTGDPVPDGLVDQQLMTLSVEAEATHIPESFEVSISGLPIGGAIHAKDVTLPSGVTLSADPEVVVVHILGAPSAEQLEAEIADSEAELGAGAAGQATGGDEGAGDVVPDTASGEGGPSDTATSGS